MICSASRRFIRVAFFLGVEESSLPPLPRTEGTVYFPARVEEILKSFVSQGSDHRPAVPMV